MPIRAPHRPDFSRSFPQPPTSSAYRNIAVTFFGLTLIIIAVAVWLSSAHAKIKVTVRQDPATLDTTVDISRSPQPGQIQGRVVEGTFDNIQEFKVTPHQDAAPVVVVPTLMNATTTGRVRITNNYSRPQTLVKTTRLLTTDGQLFRIAATVNIASGKTADVDAYSDKPGATSAIPQGTKFSIPGLWIDMQKWIFAESITVFSSTPGQAVVTQGSGTVVAQQDLDDAQQALQVTILDQAKKTLLAEAGIQPEKVADDCPADQGCWQAVYFVTPVEKKSNVLIGQASASFLAQAKLKIRAVFYPRKDMEALVRSKLKEKLPDGRDIVSLDSSTVKYEIQVSDVVNETARIGIKAQAMSRLTTSSPSLSKDAVAGLSVDDARKKLLGVSGVDMVSIVLQPSWARQLPTQTDKIELLVQ